MQPPPPPPVSNQAVCQWCSQPMNSDAIRCNSCGKVRKDIYSDKIKCYVLCIIGGLLIGISIGLWKKNRQNAFDYYYTESSADNTTSYILLAIGIIIALAGIYYYVVASRKLKTWWWA